MKKYMLIITCDRSLEEPQFFSTFDEAQDAMIADYANSIDMDIESVKTAYESGNSCHDDYGLYEDSAWLSGFSNIDWFIVNISEYDIARSNLQQ